MTLSEIDKALDLLEKKVLDLEAFKLVAADIGKALEALEKKALDLETYKMTLSEIDKALDLLEKKVLDLEAFKLVAADIGKALEALEKKALDLETYKMTLAEIDKALDLLEKKVIDLEAFKIVAADIGKALNLLEKKVIDLEAYKLTIQEIDKALDALEKKMLDLESFKLLLSDISKALDAIEQKTLDLGAYKLLLAQLDKVLDALIKNELSLGTFKLMLTQLSEILEGTLLSVVDSTYIITLFNIDFFNGSWVIVIKTNGKYYRIYISDGKIVKIEEIKRYSGKKDEYFIDLEKKVLIVYKRVTLVLSDGSTLVLEPGQYKIISYLMENGNTIIVIEYNGDKYRLYVDENGNIFKAEKYVDVTGVLTVKDDSQPTYNSDGEVTGTAKPGNYYAYETKSSSDTGTAVKLRVSPDSKADVWINYDENNTNQVDYSQFVSKQQNSNGTSVSFFDKNKTFLGALGVLFVGGAAVVATKKIMKNKRDNVNEYSEEDLQEGNYAVYDVKTDDKGLVTEARISADSDDEEYWVEM